jgi:4-amino-4-deoxy-L-arabinose transferase-like glycosyltransferase
MHSLQARLAVRPVLAIVLLGLVLNLSGTWIAPLIDRDEPRFAEASREMIERNDWVVPWFDGMPRYDKPPLIYWAQMVCYHCLGAGPFAARLPSALFATGSALLIFFWARRFTRPRTALMAAVIFLTCVQTAIHGRLAVADMPMIFFVCAALWSGWELTRPGAAFPWRWWWVFHVSLALGFLSKGPVAWLPVIGLLLGWRIHPQHFALKPGRLALGMLLTVGLVGLWGIPALRQTHGEFLYVGLGYHVLYRSFGVLDGHGGQGWLGWIATSPFYLVMFFISFFPWAPRVPRALRNWWPTRGRDIFGWYLLIQAGLVFVVFTFVRTKLMHYTLPAFPCVAIWLAKMEQDGLLANLRVARLGALMTVLIVAVTVATGLVLGPFCVAHSLFEKARDQLRPEMAIATVDYAEPSLVWEFREKLTNQITTLSAEEAVAFLQRTNPAVLIMSTSLYETNLARWKMERSVVQVQGYNFSRFDRAKFAFSKIDLTALIHP